MKIHWIALAWLICAGPAAVADVARGVVYHDENRDGVRNGDEEGVAGVWVCNGVDFVETDAGGRYEIELPENEILFVCKPKGWMTAVDENNLPRFYYAHYPEGSPPDLAFPGFAATGPLPASIDFPLYPNGEDGPFRIVVFGDPQVRNVTEVEYLARDIVQELIGVDAAFGVSLGDLAFDDLRVYPPLNQVMSRVGIPWYNVQGNHDMNYRAADDTHAADTFKRVYGPTDHWYTFGDTHFIALDNVLKLSGSRYESAIGPKRLAFVQNALDRIPRDELAVIMFHIPLRRLNDLQAFLDVCATHPNMLILSAHFHRQYHEFLTAEDGWKGPGELHHLVHGTACGNWWGGEKDELGIPAATMACGAPNGWSFIEFANGGYRIEYRAARKPADYQMDIAAPGAIAASEVSSTTVSVNVFAGSPKSVVKMKAMAEWATMQQAQRLHTWEAPLPEGLREGVHAIEVETIDMFGRTYRDYHILRVHE